MIKFTRLFEDANKTTYILYLPNLLYFHEPPTTSKNIHKSRENNKFYYIFHIVHCYVFNVFGMKCLHSKKKNDGYVEVSHDLTPCTLIGYCYDSKTL